MVRLNMIKKQVQILLVGILLIFTSSVSQLLPFLVVAYIIYVYHFWELSNVGDRYILTVNQLYKLQPLLFNLVASLYEELDSRLFWKSDVSMINSTLDIQEKCARRMTYV